MAVTLHEHQAKAVDLMHNGCVLTGDMGVGKSITAMAYFVSKVCGGDYNEWGTMATPKDVYVLTTAKKRNSLDWEAEGQHFGVDRDGNREGVRIHVESWNNIEKFKEVQGAFFIFDEQRLVGSGAWVKAFIKIAKHNEWIMLSATPGDTWLDYIPVFVANGFYKNRTEFKNKHVVYAPYSKHPKVERYLATGVLVRHRNSILVDMPYERHTTRHSKIIEVDYDKSLFERVVNDRWHVFENRPLRDVAELFSVMRKVVNSDRARVESLKRLMEIHPRLIVFYNFDYELKLLRTLAQTPSSTSWDYLLSEEGLARNRHLSSMPSVMSSEFCDAQTSCSGHWTEDDGTGEIFLPCPSSAESDTSWSKSPNSTSMSSPGVQKSQPESTKSDPSGTRFSSPTEKPTSVKSNTRLASSESIDAKSVRKLSCDSTLTVAEWNGHKHQEVPTTDRWVYLVQYQAGAEGWNCVTTDATCFFSLTYSYKLYYQAHGRIDRLNTPFTDLYYYTFKSKSLIDRLIWKALSMKKSFSERKSGL